MLKKRLGIECMERSWYCGYLTDLYKIPSTLTISDCTWIGARVFYYCNRLKKVVISESVESIGFSAFCGCKNATITLKKPKEEFKYIGSGALVGCKDVKEETGD